MRLCKNSPSYPIVRKCCFCVPIRKGVTIFGYVNLVLYLLSLPQLIFLLVKQATIGHAVEDTGYNLDPIVHLSLTIVFVIVDTAMTILLLVGTHRKKRLLLKVYLYFGMVFQVVTLCIDLVYFDYREYVENVVYFIFLGLNIYLLFLVYNTIRVIEEASEVQYVTYQEHQRNY